MCCIIDLLLEIDSIILNNQKWRLFLRTEYKKNDISFVVKNGIYEQICYGIGKISLKKYEYCFHSINSNNVVITDTELKECIVLGSYTDAIIENYLLRIFYTHAVQSQILQFHSSLIKTNGKGLMFLGPSGIGKTTQAELWNKYRNALIINGDIVFVQETPDAFLGWGTPWHGSSPYCENTSVPLKAMIVLKQAPENSIRELTGFEKVTAVSNNVFYPRWLENGMELCLETLDHLLSRIPVYELSCRPDEEAVKLTEETIFGSGSVSD